MSITDNVFPLSSRFVYALKYELCTFALSLSFAYISSFCLSGGIIDLSGFFTKGLSIFHQFLLFVSMFLTFLLLCRNNFFLRMLIMSFISQFFSYNLPSVA